MINNFNNILINIKLEENRGEMEGKSIWVRKSLLCALVRIIYQPNDSKELWYDEMS